MISSKMLDKRSLKQNGAGKSSRRFFVAKYSVRFCTRREYTNEMMNDDMALVREYARTGSEQAFATLVSRHVNLVYSVAMRQVGDPHVAEEVVQGVFIVLAKKAKTLGPNTIVSGWLCRTARFVSAHALRTQLRRQAREQEAYMQSTMTEPNADAWNEIAPLLDEALGCLNRKEHDAVVLRFLEGKAFAEVGVAIGTTEDTARARVGRAVEKLRRFFSKRGVIISATILTGVVAANSVQAAPAGLAATTTAAAVKGMAVSGTITTLVQSTMKTLTWLKMKLAVGIGIATLVAGGGTLAVWSAESAEPSVQGTEEEAMLIVPMQSVGKITKGMTTNEVEAILGKPDKWEGKKMVYYKRYGMSVVQSDQGAAAVDCGAKLGSQDQKLGYPGVKKFTGHTKEGIGMGSSKADLLRAFGPATSYSTMTVRDKAPLLFIAFQNQKLRFVLASDKVISIFVNFQPSANVTADVRLVPNQSRP